MKSDKCESDEVWQWSEMCKLQIANAARKIVKYVEQRRCYKMFDANLPGDLLTLTVLI